MSQGGKNTYMMSMKEVVSPHDCLDLSRLGVFIIWDFSSPTWIPPPDFSAVLGTLCLASHTREHKDKWPWREAPFSHISILSAATSLCSSEMGKLFGEQEQKKIPKVGLPLSFLSKGRKMELYREENSTKRETYLPSFGVYKEWMFAELKPQRKRLEQYLPC